MVKLANKEHELAQLARIKQLENDMNQQKNRITTLRNRVDNLDKELKKLKSKPKK